MHARELLVETFVHIPPARALEGLTPADAERRVSGASHSIAEIVAHLIFWQSWFTQRLEGVHEPMVQRAALGWPAVDPGSWSDLQARYLAGLERLASIGEDASRLDRRIDPAIEFPPLAQYTTRDALVHVAHHNAHHLGQIILLRQLTGTWPPPGGGWTW
jgi:uncharacterized damage-inducible protein DinB